MTDLPYIMSIEEAAEVLRCSRAHVYALAQREGLPLTRLGGRTVIRANLLEAWLDQRTETDT